MARNVGTTDRIIRFVLGLAIILAGFYFQSWLGLVGIIFLFTALMSWCPLYVLFGINTRKLST